MKKLCLVVLFVLLLVSGLIQANTITSSIEVEVLAKKHASEDVNKILPFLGGVLFGPLAPIFNYATDPQVPAFRIMDVKEKLGEGYGYLLDVYIQTYKDEVKKIKANMGWLGWASWLFIVVPLLTY